VTLVVESVTGHWGSIRPMYIYRRAKPTTRHCLSTVIIEAEKNKLPCKNKTVGTASSTVAAKNLLPNSFYLYFDSTNHRTK